MMIFGVCFVLYLIKLSVGKGFCQLINSQIYILSSFFIFLTDINNLENVMISMKLQGADVDLDVISKKISC